MSKNKYQHILSFFQTFFVELVSTSLDGSAINQNKNAVMVTILENDDPFGTFMFDNDTSVVVVEEMGRASHVTLFLVRIGGMIGDVQVRYRYIETVSFTTVHNV